MEVAFPVVIDSPVFVNAFIFEDLECVLHDRSWSVVENADEVLFTVADGTQLLSSMSFGALSLHMDFSLENFFGIPRYGVHRGQRIDDYASIHLSEMDGQSVVTFVSDPLEFLEISHTQYSQQTAWVSVVDVTLEISVQGSHQPLEVPGDVLGILSGVTSAYVTPYVGDEYFEPYLVIAEDAFSHPGEHTGLLIEWLEATQDITAEYYAPTSYELSVTTAALTLGQQKDGIPAFISPMDFSDPLWPSSRFETYKEIWQQRELSSIIYNYDTMYNDREAMYAGLKQHVWMFAYVVAHEIDQSFGKLTGDISSCVNMFVLQDTLGIVEDAELVRAKSSAQERMRGFRSAMYTSSLYTDFMYLGIFNDFVSTYDDPVFDQYMGAVSFDSAIEFPGVLTSMSAIAGVSIAPIAHADLSADLAEFSPEVLGSPYFGLEFSMDAVVMDVEEVYSDRSFSPLRTDDLFDVEIHDVVHDLAESMSFTGLDLAYFATSFAHPSAELTFVTHEVLLTPGDLSLASLFTGLRGEVVPVDATHHSGMTRAFSDTAADLWVFTGSAHMDWMVEFPGEHMDILFDGAQRPSSFIENTFFELNMSEGVLSCFSLSGTFLGEIADIEAVFTHIPVVYEHVHAIEVALGQTTLSSQSCAFFGDIAEIDAYQGIGLWSPGSPVTEALPEFLFGTEDFLGFSFEFPANILEIEHVTHAGLTRSTSFIHEFGGPLVAEHRITDILSEEIFGAILDVTWSKETTVRIPVSTLREVTVHTASLHSLGVFQGDLLHAAVLDHFEVSQTMAAPMFPQALHLVEPFAASFPCSLYIGCPFTGDAINEVWVAVDDWHPPVPCRVVLEIELDYHYTEPYEIAFVF